MNEDLTTAREQDIKARIYKILLDVHSNKIGLIKATEKIYKLNNKDSD